MGAFQRSLFSLLHPRFSSQSFCHLENRVSVPTCGAATSQSTLFSGLLLIYLGGDGRYKNDKKMLTLRHISGPPDEKSVDIPPMWRIYSHLIVRRLWVPPRRPDSSERSERGVLALAWVFPACAHFLFHSRKHIRDAFDV